MVNRIGCVTNLPRFCSASHAARCSPTTVLPVPAAPRTRDGPAYCLETTSRWSGWRKTIQSSIGSAEDFAEHLGLGAGEPAAGLRVGELALEFPVLLGRLGLLGLLDLGCSLGLLTRRASWSSAG